MTKNKTAKETVPTIKRFVADQHHQHHYIDEILHTEERNAGNTKNNNGKLNQAHRQDTRKRKVLHCAVQKTQLKKRNQI